MFNNVMSSKSINVNEVTTITYYPLLSNGRCGLWFTMSYQMNRQFGTWQCYIWAKCTFGG